jgi:hypothetical protein
MYFGFITVLILAGVLLYILEPYFTGKKLPDRFITDRQKKRTALSLKRDEVTECMRELEQDFGTGKITENDYNELINEYRTSLKDITGKIEALNIPRKKEEILKQIEAEVQLLRKSSGGNGDSLADSGKVFCNDCGKENPAGSNFCSKCGVKLI